MKRIYVYLICLFIVEPTFSQNSDIGLNLINNSYMYLLDGNKPAGYGVEGNLVIEAAHPYTKGFEGPYTAVAPDGAASNINDATADCPYWFGVYNKGSRIWRGGMAGGWHGYPDGHILKITGNSNSVHSFVTFPFESNVFPKTYRFRAWLKIVSADWVGFGTDAGYNYGPSKCQGNFSFTKQEVDQAADGWLFIDKVVTFSSTTSLDGLVFSMGISGQNIEVYLALPQLTPVDPTGWRSSVSDVISREGITIHPSTKNVGIGTYDTKGFKLAVAGSMIAEQVVVKNRDQWPDFVFDPFYKVMDLSDVERYIQRYRHLPEVPSESEVNEKGVDLVKMNSLLLKKIEELTIHVIKLDKEVKRLKKKNR